MGTVRSKGADLLGLSHGRFDAIDDWVNIQTTNAWTAFDGQVVVASGLSSREPAVVILYGDRPGLSASAPGTALADFESEHP